MLLRKKSTWPKAYSRCAALVGQQVAANGRNSPLNDAFGRRLARTSPRSAVYSPLATVGGAPARRVFRPHGDGAVAPKTGSGVFKLPGPTCITLERKPHDEGAHGRSTRSPRNSSSSRHEDPARPRFINQAIRLTPVLRLRIMQSRLRRPLVVEAAWARHDLVRSLFSLDYLTSRALTRYVRLGFLFAIAIPRLHRSLSPLVPV